MQYKCMSKDNNCPWSKDTRCLNDNADTCEYSLYVNTVFDAIKNSFNRDEMADIIQNYMCWDDVTKCPSTKEEIKEWLMEEV